MGSAGISRYAVLRHKLGSLCGAGRIHGLVNVIYVELASG